MWYARGCEVIDRNAYPVPEAENSNRKHRPIGLGVQGFADAVAFGDEPPLPAGGPVLSVSLKHEQRVEGWAGTSLPWWLGWLVIATVAALILRKPLGVVI